MILNLTGSLTGTKLVMSEWPVYIQLHFNGMSELMIPSLTGSLSGTKRESLYGYVGRDGLFIFRYTLMECRS